LLHKKTFEKKLLFTVQKQRNWVQTGLAEATEYASEAVLVLISTELT
jgi:hypothetical protein